MASVNGVRSAMFVSRHVRRLARRYGKLSPREVRFLLYAVIAFCLLVAYASTEDQVTDRVVAENFADHRREVGGGGPAFGGLRRGGGERDAGCGVRGRGAHHRD